MRKSQLVGGNLLRPNSEYGNFRLLIRWLLDDVVGSTTVLVEGLKPVRSGQPSDPLSHSSRSGRLNAMISAAGLERRC